VTVESRDPVAKLVESNPYLKPLCASVSSSAKMVITHQILMSIK
jgi:hypothetical protein